MFLCGVLIQILVCLFLLSVTLQMGYVLYFFAQVFSLKKQERPVLEDKKPVSVVICAKNQARQLEQYLPAIMAQRYTNEAGKQLFEVIVVNDASTDDTAQVLQAISKHYTNLTVVTVARDAERNLPGKKFALSKALPHINNELMLLTDADCEPASEYWMELMVAPLHAGKEIVAGYGKHKQAPGWLNGFIRWETLHTFLQYSTYAMVGKPYMAVGRNIAYTRSILMQAEQAKVWSKLPSGDDDLLMRTMAHDHNTAIVTDPQAFTLSEAKSTMQDWVAQKQRHMSTGKYYKPGIKSLLSVYGIAHALIWLLFIPLLLWGDTEMVLIAMALRCVTYWFVWAKTADMLQEKQLKLLLPLYDIGWMLYNFAFSPYIIWKNKKNWK